MDTLLVLSHNIEFYIEFVEKFASRKIKLMPVMKILGAVGMLSILEYFAIVVEIANLDDTSMIKILRQSSFIPIVAYSKEYNLKIKIASIQNGADEYFVDRGDINDILASLKALSRRYFEYSEQKEKSPNFLTLHDIIIRLNTRRVFINGEEIRLMNKEYEMLLYLIKNKHNVLSYEQIFTEIWGGTFQKKHINAVRCRMYRLTSKINNPSSPHPYIKNIKELGYQINPKLLVEKENKYIRSQENYKKCPIILAIGFESEKLFNAEHEATSHAILYQKADSLHDVLKMVATNNYSLITINGDMDDYLLNINLVREITLAPILVTTKSYDGDKKTAAICVGADGYMLITSHDEDSLETANALIRRYTDYCNREKTTMPIISYGDILLDLNNRKTTVSGREVKLTRKEFDILKLILENKGKIVPYEQICEYAWDGKYKHSTLKPLMKIMCVLKEKIKTSETAPGYILNVRELGYRLNC